VGFKNGDSDCDRHACGIGCRIDDHFDDRSELRLLAPRMDRFLLKMFWDVFVALVSSERIASTGLEASKASGGGPSIDRRPHVGRSSVVGKCR
jgi:hypothetical protein